MKKIAFVSALLLPLFSSEALYSADYGADYGYKRVDKPSSILTINKNIWKGRWHQIKGELKKRWGELTDDDFLQLEGEQERLAGLIQKRYGMNEEKAKEQVKQYYNALAQSLPYKEQNFYVLNEETWADRWSDIQNYLKDKWPNLNQSDLYEIQQNQEKLQAVLQKRYKMNEKQARKEVNDFYEYLSEAL